VIVAARVGVLLLVAVAAGWALVRGPGPDGDPGGVTAPLACPMHPEMSAAAPGRCPVCGMALVKVGPSRSEAAGQSPIQAGRFFVPGVAPVHRRAPMATAGSPAWLDAKGGVTAGFFADELRDLGQRERAAFFPARAPGAALALERVDAPPVRWRGSRWLVRFRFRAGGPPAGLRVGATGWVERPARPSLVVLSSAVLPSEAGSYLLAVTPDRRGYRRQSITTGRVASGYTVVVSGAVERDLVVGVNAFSLDADARLQAQRRAAADGIE
jgi:hypothetical protein